VGRCTETGRWVRVDQWDTGFADLAGEQGLLGQREGRTSAAVIDWLSKRSDEFRAWLQFVAIDPAAVYASAIRAPGLFAQRDDRGRPLPPGDVSQRRTHQGAPPCHLGIAGSSRPADRPGMGQPATTVARAGPLVAQHFRQDMEPNPGRGPVERAQFIIDTIRTHLAHT
jgi:hypothetical protein